MIDSEGSRLKAFRQMKAQIRGSKEHLIVGIDIAKEKHRAFFGTPTGKTLRYGSGWSLKTGSKDLKSSTYGWMR